MPCRSELRVPNQRERSRYPVNVSREQRNYSSVPVIHNQARKNLAIGGPGVRAMWYVNRSGTQL